MCSDENAMGELVADSAAWLAVDAQLASRPNAWADAVPGSDGGGGLRDGGAASGRKRAK